MNNLVLNINGIQCQTAEFGNSQASIEEDIHQIKILTIYLARLHEIKEPPHILWRNGIPCLGIVHQHIHFKIERIEGHPVRLQCVLECWL